MIPTSRSSVHRCSSSTGQVLTCDSVNENISNVMGVNGSLQIFAFGLSRMKGL